MCLKLLLPERGKLKRNIATVFLRVTLKFSSLLKCCEMNRWDTGGDSWSSCSFPWEFLNNPEELWCFKIRVLNRNTDRLKTYHFFPIARGNNQRLLGARLVGRSWVIFLTKSWSKILVNIIKREIYSYLIMSLCQCQIIAIHYGVKFRYVHGTLNCWRWYTNRENKSYSSSVHFVVRGVVWTHLILTTFCSVNFHFQMFCIAIFFELGIRFSFTHLLSVCRKVKSILFT